MGLFERLDENINASTTGNDNMDDSHKPRVVFLGIDGVPYELVNTRPDVFPTLHELASDGVLTRMRSTLPPESSACWPVLTTGVNPGKTGVYGFQERRPGSYETYVPTGRDVAAERVWEHVTRAGQSAAVLNVPVTYPPEQSVERMVSGFLSPSRDDAAASQETAALLETHEYRVDADVQAGLHEEKDAFITDVMRTLETRGDVFTHSVMNDAVDLFFGVFMTPDRINHFLFRDYVNEGEYYDEFIEFYRALDAQIGRICDSAPDDTTFIIASDHGFTELTYELDLNAWLRENDWLQFNVESPAGLSDIAPHATAYALIPGRIYLHVADREPHGSVSMNVYEETCGELIRALQGIRTPDGKPALQRVFRGDDVYDGPYADRAPDIVALPTPGVDLKAGFDGDSPVFKRSPRTGMHQYDNACLIANTSLETESVALQDITPTILDSLDVSYNAAQFDGQSRHNE